MNAQVDESLIRDRVKDSGYVELSRPHENSPGYLELVVAIRQTPTELHFDPEAIHLRLVYRDDTVRETTIMLTNPPLDVRQVCPGPVTLVDRIGKRVDFFVFGGQLKVFTRPCEAICWLHSPAPILELAGQAQENFSDQLIYETEAALARLGARWEGRHSAFLSRLAKVDSLQLYAASISACIEQQDRLRRRHSGVYQGNHQAFYHHLTREKNWLAQAGCWHTHHLNDLLAQ